MHILSFVGLSTFLKWGAYACLENRHLYLKQIFFFLEFLPHIQALYLQCHVTDYFFAAELVLFYGKF